MSELSDEQKQQLEAKYTYRRVLELSLSPVKGNFDAAHLREINRRVFQDLPGLGFKDVTPGVYRPEVPEGKDWIKRRGFSTFKEVFSVAYSPMDAKATARLDEALVGADPTSLRDLKTTDFATKIADLYIELDYIHPFPDGNSRTLRTFTAQLAHESGYHIDWPRFNRSDEARDRLYIARDLAVNKIALPLAYHESTMRALSHAMFSLEGNKELPDLLKEAIRPARAIAFEQWEAKDALSSYPELAEAYNTLRAAQIKLTSSLPDKPAVHEAVLEVVTKYVLQRLDQGETADFTKARDRLQELGPDIEV